MADESAIDELIRRASDPAGSGDALREAIEPAFATLKPNDRAGAESFLRRLADEVVDAPTRPDMAGMIAMLCGALVERGLPPMIALGSILNRLEHQVAPDAIEFVAACQQAAEDAEPPAPSSKPDSSEPNGAEQKPPDPIEKYGEQIANLMPTAAEAFRALEPFSLAAIAMLSRSMEARRASWQRTSLRRSLAELGGQYGHAGMLWMMLQVLDDEPVVVIHPEQAKGYQVRISGLAENFQLHTLLADALIGRFSSQWLRGKRPGRVEVAAARNGPIQENGPHATGSFNLWSWRGLKRDGTLRDAMGGSAHWIWNEGVPNDIPSFEGTRLVLLGPPPYPRYWNAIRRFPDMPGDLRVEKVMTHAEVSDILRRIAAAVEE